MTGIGAPGGPDVSRRYSAAYSLLMVSRSWREGRGGRWLAWRYHAFSTLYARSRRLLRKCSAMSSAARWARRSRSAFRPELMARVRRLASAWSWLRLRRRLARVSISFSVLSEIHWGLGLGWSWRMGAECCMTLFQRVSDLLWGPRRVSCKGKRMRPRR